MKKLLVILALGVALTQAPLQALLPPLFQSMEEFKALSLDKRLTEKLESGESVVSITRFDKKYTVITNRHKINVDVIYDKTNNNGPAKFHFVFHDPQPLNTR
jgi:hypothetical protein